LRNAGAEVLGLYAIFTYGFKRAVDAFAAANCKFDTLSNYDALLEHALEIGYISDNQLDALKKWRHAPEDWK